MTDFRRKPSIVVPTAISAFVLMGACFDAPANAQNAAGTQQQPATDTSEDADDAKKGRKHKGRKEKHDRRNGAAQQQQQQYAPPDAKRKGFVPPPAKTETRKPIPARPTTVTPAKPHHPPAATTPPGVRSRDIKPTAKPYVPPPKKPDTFTRKPQTAPAPSVYTPPVKRKAPDTVQRKDTSKRDAGFRERRGRFNIEQMRARRTERKEDGGKRTIFHESDRRTIVRQGRNLVIQKDEALGLKRIAPNARVTRNNAGVTTTVVARPNGRSIVTETNRSGQLIRRYRRGPGGRETIIIDNRRRKSSTGRDIAIGIGVGIGVAAILNAIVDVPPPRVRVPRDKYIVDYESASEDDIYEALNAPPVDEIDGYYTLDQVRATRNLRERMRRVDLDDINFETGSWDVDPSEYRKLERIARAMKRIIRRNPDEVFLVEGYTDAIGSDVDNLGLSDRRAESVAAILTEEFDVPFENLTTQGYGEQFLKIETDGPERANRRVAVRRITPLMAQARRDGGRDRDDYDRGDYDGGDDRGGGPDYRD